MVSLVAAWQLVPFIILILVAVPTWTSASGIWLSEVKSMEQEIRFGPKNYCRYNVTIEDSIKRLEKAGCISTGWSYQVDVSSLDLDIPASISQSLSKAAILLVICFSVILVAFLWQMYTVRYCTRKSPEPQPDKVYSVVTIHLMLTLTAVGFLWIAFVSLLAVCVSASQDRGMTSAKKMNEGGIRLSIGPSLWVLLTAAILSVPWGYEALRWRNSEYRKSQ